MTKSPRAVAREAWRLAETVRPAYSSTFSRQDFTQPQRFALLAPKTFFKTDYRDVVPLLDDFAERRTLLALDNVPHYAPLGYAAQRLSTKGRLSCSSPKPPCAPTRAA